MAKHPIDFQAFHLYACLPFVELDHESMIQIGPVIFWPASKSKEFLDADFHSLFQAYMRAMSQIKAPTKDPEGHFVNTRTLTPKGTTCVSIAEDIPSELRELILIDSLYLLYFACTFRNLYYGQEIPSFNAFRKMIPASFDFIRTKQNWEDLYIEETDHEETICLHIVDPEICLGLGKALNAIYQNPIPQEKELIQAYKRLIRSIRYLVDRFFQRFVNLFGKGLNFSEEIFEPEDVIFLASSFETLFDLNDKHPAADFKHKLRPLLHLKYSKPVEIFWKWVDDFYGVKRRIVNGDPFLDPLFRLNPNFEISHIFLGIKLFIYAVYYNLFKFHLLQSAQVNLYTPPDFKWIHPEEILLFFWTESTLLRKLNLFIKQTEQEPIKEELLADIHLLTHLFVSLYERYDRQQQLTGQGVVRFIPTPVKELKEAGYPILDHLKQAQIINPKKSILQVIHPHFIQVLQERLQEKKKQKRQTPRSLPF
jgi:hypothetical protein